ncbi:unnamed protein product [Meloidogyne enterolobii]|uniref:Uncharacterized protein n=1 Tax=Meloidogyne enterolobii TaxID=390850 RepID=A0ACB1AEL9_MELEN
MYTPLLHRSQRGLDHKNLKQVEALKIKMFVVLLGKFVCFNQSCKCFVFSGKVCS